MWGQTRFLIALYGAYMATASTLLGGDASYVVRLHTSVPEALSHLQQSSPTGDDDTSVSSKFQGEAIPMTASNGKRYMCYVPASPDVKEISEPKAKRTFLEIGREAASKLKPHCLPTVEQKLEGSFEICHGKTITFTPLENGATQSASISHKFVGDEHTLGFTDYEFRNSERYPEDGMVQERLKKGELLYTQSFGQSSDSASVIVQYACWNSPVTSLIGRRLPNLASPSKVDHATAFLFGSRWFCLDNDAESVNDVRVLPFIAPSFESNECIRRTEGWWTYEYCVSNKVSQYHREQNGELTAEFSLGEYDKEANELAISKRKAIVSEFLDDTYDKPQPAFEEVFEGGTACDEVGRKRWTRVLMFCPALKKQAPYILSIQESATCSYLMKVAVPSICEHPFFAKEERLRSELLSQTIHCVPASETTESITTSPKDRSSTKDEL